MKPREFSAFIENPFEVCLEPLEEQFGMPAPDELLEFVGESTDRFVCMRPDGPVAWSTQQVLPGKYTDKSTLFFVQHLDPDGTVVRPVCFRNRLKIVGKKAFSLDDRVVADLRQRMPELKKVSERQLCEWMTEEFVLKASGASEFLFIAVHSMDQSSDEDHGFTLVGRDYLARIEVTNGTLIVDTVFRRRGQTFGAYDCWDGSFFFTLDTVEAKLKDPVFEQQLQRRSADPTAFLTLWRRYLELDKKRLETFLAKAGDLVYQEMNPPEEGSSLREFSLKSSREKVEQFVRVITELMEDEPQVEVVYAERTAARLVFHSIDASMRRLTLKWDHEGRRELPASGVLRLALHGWQVANERRIAAFEKLVDARCDIRTLHCHLLETPPPQPKRLPHIRFGESQLKAAFGDKLPNDAQRAAIEICFNSPDIALIQGPPGTGKTQVISALQRLIALQQKPKQQPESILLTSYQHDAVDNMADRASVFGLPAYRFGSKVKEQGEFGFMQWRRDMLSVLEDNIAAEEKSELLQQLRELKTEALYLLNANVPNTVLLDRLAEFYESCMRLQPRILNPDTLLRLKNVRCRYERFFNCNSPVTQQLRLALWGLRTTAAGYADDGSLRLQCLLDLLAMPDTKRLVEGVFSDEEQIFLGKICAREKSPSSEELQSIESFQWEVLKELSSGRERQNACKEALKTCIGELLGDVNRKLSVCPAGRADILEEFYEIMQADSDSVRDSIAHYTMAYATTCQKSGSSQFMDVRDTHHFYHSEQQGFDYVVIDEAARANPLDLFIPMVLGKKKIILVGDHKQLPHLLEPEIEKELTETGVENNPLKESMFERLWCHLRSKPNGISRTVSLTTQYRMHPELGRFISQTFYEQEGVVVDSPRAADQFVHTVSEYAGRFAVWEDCEEGREQRQWRRPSEARRVAEIASDILRNSSESVGIITMYRAQEDELKAALMSEDLMDSHSVREEYASRVRVGTVDSFQGREFDVVILSPVRSNDLKALNSEDARRKFGFLTFENRLNVALSRQRKLLIVVGDRKMYQSEDAKAHVHGLYAFEKLCREGSCN
jgi:DNA polymerase III delta prime subunit